MWPRVCKGNYDSLEKWKNLNAATFKIEDMFDY